MKIQRLSWAGLLIEHLDKIILVDPVEDFSFAQRFMGTPKQPVFVLNENVKADIVLLTHLHPDHYDPKCIKNHLKSDGKVLCSTLFKDKLIVDGFSIVDLSIEEVFKFGELAFIPVFAMDGIGDDQVSWIVKNATGKSIIHCGDTIWHNQFWKLGKKYGEFEMAFLPINGSILKFPHVTYSPIPASMTPPEAIVASKLLKAKRICPIHYKMFSQPPLYIEYPDAENAIRRYAEEYEANLILVEPGGFLEI